MIKEKLLTINKFSRVGKKLNSVNGVVIHYTGVPGQKAEQTVAYFESLKNGTNQIYASSHYVINTDGTGILCVPENEVTYNCGAREYKLGIVEKLSNYPNYTTISIELCITENGNFTEETLETTSKLVAQILTEHDLTISDVYRHYDITGKICPKFFVEDEEQWKEFLKRIEGKLCQ